MSITRIVPDSTSATQFVCHFAGEVGCASWKLDNDVINWTQLVKRCVCHLFNLSRHTANPFTTNLTCIINNLTSQS